MISHTKDNNFIKKLSDNYYGIKILSYYNAYGTGYDFCRFYESEKGVAMQFNSSAIFDGDFLLEDIGTFVEFNKPDFLEISQETPPFEGYKLMDRTLFQFTIPIQFERVEISEDVSLDKHFQIVKDGFPETDYELWLVDTSHRIRHGVSRIFAFEDRATATMEFCVNDFAFFTKIATQSDFRGQGVARKMLYSIGKQLESEGKNCYLYAQPHREGFYKSIGFTQVYRDKFQIKI